MMKMVETRIKTAVRLTEVAKIPKLMVPGSATGRLSCVDHRTVKTSSVSLFQALLLSSILILSLTHKPN